jgi:hypothetical protein
MAATRHEPGEHPLTEWTGAAANSPGRDFGFSKRMAQAFRLERIERVAIMKIEFEGY